MDITNPRRILAVSLADSTHHLSRVIRDLTGSTPEPATGEVVAVAEEAEAEAEAATASLAGTTHNLALSTPYYTAQVPIWLDVVAAPADWAASFLSPEAREVLAVLGGVVVVFGLPSSSPPSSSSSESAAQTKELIAHVGRVVREGLGGWDWDGVSLGIGVGDLDDGDLDALDEWEDCCTEWGLEFVHARATPAATPAVPAGGGASGQRNEFGEKMGIPRVLEALQVNDWSGADSFGDDDGEEDYAEAKILSKGKSGDKLSAGRREDTDEDDESDPDKLDFGFDREDFVGLRKAILAGGGDGDSGDDEALVIPETSSGGAAVEKASPTDVKDEGKEGDGDEKLGDEDVQKLERMMRKLQAVRGMSAGMPEEQRKRMAKKAVTEVMKEL
ncbi:alpha and gamma adaptin binding protein p34-domain-containing protein [Lasiosphaeria miniovina]|uniref:Alpha and gamma adaptin binding protein p34-domain-containing protein n=1 Tax=Lasiosphaeria miniovina TaxID=1954250 RepID=A0AA40E4I9_9PEZI|nr:alpha and gamma adaptin binding protein p34-domain-containing protein [Lasiosphaeria miniovina]KAK0727849.1 alpha and gamma adaptin binding protein p34-domain-containing protein [Lasiosphaeria miniovina]